MARVYITCCSRCGKEAPHLIAAAAGKAGDEWIAKADGELLHNCADGTLGRAEEYDLNEPESIPKLEFAHAIACPVCGLASAFPKKFLVGNRCRACRARRVADDQFDIEHGELGKTPGNDRLARFNYFAGWIHGKFIVYADLNPHLPQPQSWKIARWCINSAGEIYDVAGDTHFERVKDAMRKTLGAAGSNPRLMKKLLADINYK